MIQPPIRITQGDSAVLYLIAVDGENNPVNLTGMSLATMMNAPNGSFTVSFPNSQHTINPDQLNFTGYFTLALSTDDTGSIGLGFHKEILTQATLSSNRVVFRGFNSLEVFPPVPFE